MHYLVERVSTFWTGRVDDSEQEAEFVGLFSGIDVAKELCNPFVEWDNDIKTVVNFKITHLDVDKVCKEEPVVEFIGTS